MSTGLPPDVYGAAVNCASAIGHLQQRMQALVDAFDGEGGFMPRDLRNALARLEISTCASKATLAEFASPGPRSRT